jgi:hypothetical protein
MNPPDVRLCTPNEVDEFASQWVAAQDAIQSSD